jgi:hypothetical protein
MRVAVIASTIIAIAFAVSAASAAPKGQGKQVSGSPPHASTTGMAARSDVAAGHGANKRGFCPPGQAKKPGRGSAFRC